MRRLGWPVVLVAALTLGAGAADASEEMRPIGRIHSDGSAAAEPEGRWRPAAPSPLLPRIHPQVLAVGEQVLVFGGYLGGPCPPDAGCKYDAPGYARDVAFLDPATGVWRPVAPLPVFLGVESAVVSAGKVYVYGREARLTDHSGVGVPERDRRTFLELDPLTGLWTALPPPPADEEFGGLRLIDAGGRLLAIKRWRSGGRAGATYDPVNRTWATLPADPPARPGTREGELVGAWAGDRLHLAVWHQDVRTEEWWRTIAALDLGTGRWTRLDIDGGVAPVAVADSLVFPGEGVYDAVTRRFRALPPRLRTTGYRVPIRDGIVAADRVTLNGHLFDPLTRQAVRLHAPPAPGTQDEGFAATRDFLVRFGGSADGEHPTNAAHVLRLPAERSRWAPVGPAPMAPAYGAAAVYLGGRFLVLGGRTGFRCPDAASCGNAFPEVFGHEPGDYSRGAALLDPGTGLWTPAAPLPSALQPQSAVVSRGIAYAYGHGPDGAPHLFAYDPVSGTWSRLPAPAELSGRDLGGLSLVDAGGTLVAVPEYRYGAGPLLRYDGEKGRWEVLPGDPLQGRGYQGTAAVWADGLLMLVASAYHDRDLGPVRLAALDLATGRWARIRPSQPIVGSVYEPPVVAGGLVVWARGVLDPATGEAWRTPTGLLPPRGGRAVPPVAVGTRVVLAGHLYDPRARTLERLPAVPPDAAHDREPAVAGGPGLLLRHGGARYRPYTPTNGHPTAETHLLRLR